VLRRRLRAWDGRFEAHSLQRRVRCEAASLPHLAPPNGPRADLHPCSRRFSPSPDEASVRSQRTASQAMPAAPSPAPHCGSGRSHHRHSARRGRPDGSDASTVERVTVHAFAHVGPTECQPHPNPVQAGKILLRVRRLLARLLKLRRLGRGRQVSRLRHADGFGVHRPILETRNRCCIRQETPMRAGIRILRTRQTAH
jgi:hypothetical protein